MARPLRIEFPGALYHVMSRGNERKAIVRDDLDREKRLDWLRRTVQTHGWRLHAFVLMGNHEHLFVETREANLSRGMQYLGGSYTSYFNRRHRRSGHLFQGRYKAQLVEADSYLLELSRYIHLNPVRAKLVAQPEAYRWSSFQGYARAARSLPWVTHTRVLGEFGGETTTARRAYARFVRSAIAEPPPSPLVGAVDGLLLGSERFVAKMRRLLRDRPNDNALPQLTRLKPRPALSEIVETVAAHFGHDTSHWKAGRRVEDASRAIAAYVARRHFGYPARAVATALGYGSHGGVHNALVRIESGPSALRQTAEELCRQFH